MQTEAPTCAACGALLFHGECRNCAADDYEMLSTAPPHPAAAAGGSQPMSEPTRTTDRLIDPILPMIATWLEESGMVSMAADTRIAARRLRELREALEAITAPGLSNQHCPWCGHQAYVGENHVCMEMLQGRFKRAGLEFPRTRARAALNPKESPR